MVSLVKSVVEYSSIQDRRLMSDEAGTRDESIVRVVSWAIRVSTRVELVIGSTMLAQRVS